MTIPVMKPWLGPEEQAAAAETIESGWIAQGPRVAAFERAFAERLGVADAVATSSCTTALHLCLHALGLRAGDDVVTPSWSYIATANAVRCVGAAPVFADVDPTTGNLTAETIEAVLTPATKAVVVVHQAGVPADMPAISALCERHGLAIVEDAACAVGSTLHGRPVGAGARLAAFSFHPRKLLTTGEGGMITTTDRELAARLRRLREHGMSVSAAERHRSDRPVIEEYLETGFNYRMTDIQAAIGLVQLQKLDDLIVRRREQARRYHRAFSSIPGMRAVEDPPYGTTNYQSFWVELEPDTTTTRDELLASLAASEISARRGIMAAHLEPAYATAESTELPITERLTANSLILPLYHDMTPDEQQSVVNGVQAAVRAPGNAERLAPAVLTHG